jgi:hypothetical protein
MSEAKTYRTFREKVFKPHDRVTRIENAVGTGQPDVNICVDGVESWVEIKSPQEPVRPTTKLFGSNHKLLLSQRNWMLEQRNAKGRAWVLIETDKRWMLISHLHGDAINDRTVSGLIAISDWLATKPVMRPDWEALREALKR